MSSSKSANETAPSRRVRCQFANQTRRTEALVSFDVNRAQTISNTRKPPQEAGLSLVVAASISTSQPQDHRICRQGRACERRDNAGDAERMLGLRHTVLVALPGYRQAVELPGTP